MSAAALSAGRSLRAISTAVQPGVPDLMYCHLMKTGGTSLSVLLYYATTVVEGSHISNSFADDAAMAKMRKFFPADNTLAFVKTQNESMQSLRRSSLRVAYGHNTIFGVMAGRYTDLGLHAKKARFLVLLRSPWQHRLSWFNSKLGTAKTFGNFSKWIRGKKYVEKGGERSMQMKFHSNLCHDRLTAGEDLDGIHAAAGLLNNPRVPWVGVSDFWFESMVSLELVLGVPLLEHALMLHSRIRNPVADLESNFKTEDYAYFMTLEADESLFVDAIARDVRYRAMTHLGH